MRKFPGNVSYYSGKSFNLPCCAKLILKYLKPFHVDEIVYAR